MSTVLNRLLAILMAAVMISGAFSGCSKGNKTDYNTQRKNDIVTFDAPQEGKEIVRVAFAMKMDWKPFIDILNKQFPDKQFIYDYYATAGKSPSIDTVRRIIADNDYDLVVANYWYAPLIGSDISNEAFLDNYFQTTLDSLAVEGHIYGIPLPTSTSGIYYNKDLFAANGWSIPASTDEFITLCQKIKSAGLIPFDSCLKYETQTTKILEGFLYDQMFNSQEGMDWYSRLIEGKASFSGYAEPLFQMAEKFFNNGVLSTDSFNASLTEMRKDFLNGKVAMIDYSSDLLSLAKAEGCTFEIGLAPYPSSTGKNQCVLYNPSAVLYIPASIKNNADRFKFDTSVMEFLSTSEGQDSLLTAWSGVVSVKDYSGSSELYKQVSGYIENGTYHAVLSFSPEAELSKPLETLINNAVKEIGEGKDIKTAEEELDSAYSETLSKGVTEVEYETIAEATDDFTVLETSYYIADKIRQATSADIAIVPNGGFYRSNMADIPKGSITNDTRLFYQKGIGDKDYITTYELTGSQLLEMLEHPVINGTEETQFIAASGMKVEYAPWHSSSSKLVKAELEDGTPVEEDKIYTVAAYAGVIDESYISSQIQVFDTLGDPQSFIESSLRSDKTISPDIGERVKLDWDIS
jgi:raffinose/stachyose/melibiose transport system substrate-binding protein